jgi:hypothetical protein
MRWLIRAILSQKKNGGNIQPSVGCRMYELQKQVTPELLSDVHAYIVKDSPGILLHKGPR